jgi:hypothetical protein
VPGTCPVVESPPQGWRILRGPVAPELVAFAIAVRDRIRPIPYNTIADERLWRGNKYGAWVSHHPYTYRNGELVWGCFKGVAIVVPFNPLTDKADPGLSVPDPDAATWTGPAFDWIDTLLGVAIGALGVMWWRAMR